MSDITHIVNKYADNESSLDETIADLSRLGMTPAPSNGAPLEGSWSEIEAMLNQGILSFTQYRTLSREYRRMQEQKTFVILGEDYGYVSTWG